VKLKPADIRAFLASPPAKVAAVLVYGPDSGLVRERGNAPV
jgi:DNA polymerase III subunit delta